MKKLTARMQEALDLIERANMTKDVKFNSLTLRALAERGRIVYAYPGQIAKDANVSVEQVLWFMKDNGFVESYVTYEFYADLVIDLHNTRVTFKNLAAPEIEAVVVDVEAVVVEQVVIADSSSTSEDAMAWAVKQGLLKLDQDRGGLNAAQNQLLELMDNNDGVLTADKAALFSEHDILGLLVYKFIHYYNDGTEYALPHKWFELMMAQAQTKTDAIIGKFVEALDAVDDEITNEHSVLKQIRMNEQITIWWDCPFKHFSESSATVKLIEGIGWRCFLELNGVINGVEKSWIEQGGEFLESLEKGRYRLKRRYVKNN
jgi:hypothetical protein